MSTIVTLRPVADGDLMLLAGWFNMPHVSPWLDRPEAWFKEIQERHTTYDWIKHFIAMFEDKPFGFCQYYEYARTGKVHPDNNELEGAYAIDFLIGDEYYLGRGFGSELVSAISRKALADAAAKKLVADPDIDNDSAIRSLLGNDYGYDKNTGLFVAEAGVFG